MKWPVALAVAMGLVAASCSGPERPEGWSVGREAPGGAAGTDTASICNDMTDLALGARATDTDLADTVEELARISAVVGATEALPALDRVSVVLAEGGELFDFHDDLVTAATSIDTAAFAACRLPLFGATYAATGWAGCHGELVIPVAGYTRVEPGQKCSLEGLPSFLPCFDEDPPHLPVDCNTGEVVQLRGGDWVPAGELREVAAPTTTTTPAEATTTTTTPPLAYVDSGPCRALAGLFIGADPVMGTSADLRRLAEASIDLGPEVVLLIEDIVVGGGINPAAKDQLLALDLATANGCGLPMMSAWSALAGGVDDLPCWRETGDPHPAFKPVDCVG